MRKLISVAYYMGMLGYIFAFAVYLPFREAEEAMINYTNNTLREYKEVNRLNYVDENSTSVKQIRTAGFSLLKAKYKELSGPYSLFSCCLALVFMYFSKLSRQIDHVLLLLFYAVIYSYGSMAIDYFFALAGLILFFAYLKRIRIEGVRLD